MLNIIGLDKAKADKLASELNNLLANYQLFYQNLRGAHWNIKGDKFFELHAKFEELYNDALLKVDEIAERVLTLEHTPTHTFQEYLDSSEIKQVKDVSDGRALVEATLNGFSILVKKEREILSLAADAEDEGTVSLMSDYITEQEKTIWMLSSFLGN